jgi:hypothetical protein
MMWVRRGVLGQRAGVASGVRAGAACLAALTIVGCGGATRRETTASTRRAPAVVTTSATAAATAKRPAPKAPPPPAYPQLLPAALGTGPASFAPAVRWQGRTAAWITRLASGVTLMSFDQHLLELHLHSGTVDAGALGWHYGPAVVGPERTRLAAAFNGGFKLSVGAGGFQSFGRIASPLQSSLASIVTYADGTTDIGSWHEEVPAPGKQVVSVRQNLGLLIDHGSAAANVDCVSCWGATLGGVVDPARSAVGITASGQLVWAGGEHLTVSQLASALLSAHVVRAAELDINPEWVAGYFYGHRGGLGPLVPVPALTSQQGIPGQFLAPWSRDFFTIVAR